MSTLAGTADDELEEELLDELPDGLLDELLLDELLLDELEGAELELLALELDELLLPPPTSVTSTSTLRSSLWAWKVYSSSGWCVVMTSGSSPWAMRVHSYSYSRSVGMFSTSSGLATRMRCSS